MTADTLTNKKRPAHLLVVEDNHGDIVLMKRAFAEAHLSTQITAATTGEEALAILRKAEENADHPMPDIILLDLNLPQMSGHQVLEIVKSDNKLKHIPIVVFSSSRADSDVMQSYDLHANGYIVKPLGLDHFNDVIRKLEQFWFMLAVMPDTHTARKAS